MSILTRSALKNLFQDGDRPTGQNFSDWLDSYVHQDDTATTVTVTTSGSYALPANKLLEVVVWESSGSLKVGTTVGGEDIIDHSASAPGGVFRVDFYRFSNQTLYFTGTGTLKMYIR